MSVSGEVRIGVALDGSESSWRALDTALKTMHADHLFLITCVQGVDTGPNALVGVHKWQEMLEERTIHAKQLLEEAESRVRPQLAGTIIDKRCIRGEIREALTDLVNDLHLDVLFVGSRGLTTISGLFLGSVSQYLATHVGDTSVCVVR